MTDKERCDKCEFYEGPPQSDEKVAERPVNAFGRPGQRVQPTPDSMSHGELGTCHGAPPTADLSGEKNGRWPRVKADDWCGMFKEKSP